jgi:DNA-binding response OmpR family regulator
VRILLVEDESSIATAVRTGLEDEKYAVEVVVDGEAGLAAARAGGYDLVILDILLPRMSGMEICRRLRAARSGVPILMLTARDATRDIVAGLDAGANDYLTKPFSFEELLARVRALIRTSTKARAAVVRIGPLAVDTVARRATRDGVALDLTAKEYQLLEYLAIHQGEVVSKDRLSRSLWAHDDEPESNAIEVYVASLRRKLGGASGAGLIQTIRGAGYLMREVPE